MLIKRNFRKAGVHQVYLLQQHHLLIAITLKPFISDLAITVISHITATKMALNLPRKDR